MTTETKLGQNVLRWLSIAVVLALVVVGGLWWTLRDADKNHITAYFTSSIGLYEGNSVRMLGVETGTINKIEPQGDRVKIEFDVDRKYPVPANAEAAIVSPSLVSDRYVQLAPSYKGGPKMSDGAVIPLNRTAVPLETDDLYKSLTRVSDALGPNGVNKKGALSDLLNTTAQNFQGNGQALHDTITHLSQAAGTLAGNKDDLFSTIQNLASFSTTLANSDGQVRQFEQQLAGVSDYLAGERDNLAQSVKQLGTALGSVQGFIENNRGRLRTNVDKLSSVTKVLVDQRNSLAQTLDVAPVGLSNLVNTYNASSGTLDARPILNELTQPPIAMVCGLLKQTPQGLNALGDVCNKVAPILDGALPLPSAAQVITGLKSGQLPPLPLPLVGSLYGSPTALGGSK
jgi:phospholipid/cholesterol/gamma-HCH transport system substrate-binding protein